jgi:Protein of unknown function (DUF3105)
VAKKPRTPPPPRKVQAPKQRHTSRQGLDPARRRQLLYGAGGAVVIGVVIALVAVLASGKSSNADAGSDKKVAAAMAAAGCTFLTKPVLPPVHKVTSGFHADVPTLTSKVKWSTFPPSGGSHYGLWAVWGFYTQPVNERQVVHNEEHGGVIMWWGPKVSEETVAELRNFYDDSPTGMFGTPIAGLGNKIALTAWTGDPSRYYQDGYYGVGHLATCTKFDQKAFETFRDAYRGHGPEGVPLSADQQGSGPSS